jgi:hypothetical protein
MISIEMTPVASAVRISPRRIRLGVHIEILPQTATDPGDPLLLSRTKQLLHHLS